MSKVFKRTIEDFTCGHCGHLVKGNGYTSHCPKCLWSKHVDNNPGDRASTCHGLMEPVGVEQPGQEYKLIHRCTKCGIEKKNKVVPEDDFEAVLACAKGVVR